MSNIYGPILPLQLDSRNTEALVRAIQTRIFLESDGQLSDFTPASPLASIVEGQAFAQSELLYYLNNLPEAFSLQWLRQLGVQRKIGSRAYVDVTFFKVPGFAKVVLIPKNTKVYASNGLAFETLEDIKILETQDSITAPCRSERWGSVYNVGSGSISKIEKNFAGLEFLTNDSPATGGSDLESVDDMKRRAFEVLSRRNLTSSNDFENEVRSLLPEAGIVKVLTYEEKFELSELLSGNVFIVVGDSEGQPLSQANLSSLISSMKDRVTIGTNISFISPEIVPVDISLNILYNPESISDSLDFLANQVFGVLDEFISPSSIGLGGEILYQDITKQLNQLEFIRNINSLDLKTMITDGTVIEGSCAGFSGEEDIDNNTCVYNYSNIINETNQVLKLSSPIESLRLYRAEIGLISSIDSSILTFTFDNLYTPQS